MLKKLFIITAMILAICIPNSDALELNAKAYFVAHTDSDTVIMEKNADEQIAPASLAKLMTVYLLFDSLKNGEVTLQSLLPISKKAWKKAGSKMFVEVGKTVKVEDLIKGIVVSSGNDACIVVAEYLGGSEKGFVEMMNEKAAELGMTNTVFRNASGWPHPEQLTTAQDMYKLTKAITTKFPGYYNYFSLTSFTYSGIRQQNRNGLLKQNVGVDGLKTGHTEESGFHLIASSKKNGARLISVVLGTDSFHSREQESLTGLTYGHRRYKNFNLIEEGFVVEKMAPVQYGEQKSVALVAAENVTAFLAKKERAKLKTVVEYKKPLVAPLKKGQKIGIIQVINPTSGDVYQSDLLVAKSVAELGFFAKLLAMVWE